MPYYTKVLLPDEQVRVVAHLHWAIFLRAWFFLIVALAAGIATGYLYQNQPADTGEQNYPAAIAGAAALVFLVLGLIALASALVRRAATEIIVTDRRIIFKEGVMRRRTMEMNMNKVETVDVIQTITGRLFNFGTVLIRGVGSSYEPLHLIANPLALRTAIVAQ